MPRLRDVGEFEALRRLTAALAGNATVIVGPGDDAAILRPAPGMDLVATTDAFVEGRHYLPDWLPAAGRGARLAAANLSDLAAMAAVPRWALLSIGARAEHEIEPLLALQHGLERSLEAEGAVLVGGNITATDGPEWLSLTLLGEVARGRAWTRRGARPGDLIAASGHPGRAGTGLRLATRSNAPGRDRVPAEWQPLMDAWLEPRGRVALAQALAATGAVMAAIDISDGLLGDLGHLCEGSGVGAELRAEAAAADPLLARAADTLGVEAFDLWAGPSDDYELLLAVDPSRGALCEQAAGAAGVTLAFVGRFTDAPGVMECVDARGSRRVIGAGGPGGPAGFDHFARG